MENLFRVWASRIPKYDEKFRDTLFKSRANKGTRDEDSVESLGKHFSRNYELYMYAFFLGLYRDLYVEIPKEATKVDFSHHIQYWGNKSSRGRESFSDLQEYMFVALIAKTDIDIIALEKDEIKVEKIVRQLLDTMEAYTNGGLIFLQEKGEENRHYHLVPDAFLKLILEAESK
ncbi:MAG: glycoside hydrolase family 15 [Bacteroidota bacterium]